MFDIYTIIFLVLAVFIFLRLRSVLGQKTGRERPPGAPYEQEPAARRDTLRPSTNDNVVSLPQRNTDGAVLGAADEPAAPVERWKGFAEAGSATANGLDAIVAQDPSFDPKHFVAGARAAYEMIVTAYAQGNRRDLKTLLSKEVYDGFEAAIKDRETRGEKAETRFVSIDKADLIGAEVKARTAQVTVRFVSQLVSVTRDKDGNVIDGSPDKVSDVTDVWTFAHDLSSRDPNWKLVATEAETGQ